MCCFGIVSFRFERKITKRIRNKHHEKRLKKFDLVSLSKRMLRGDLIEVLKMFASSSGLLRVEGGVGGEEPPFCCPFVSIK